MKNTDKLRLLVPMHEIEQGAQQQIYAALDLPFLLKMAAMPDVHRGYGLPIGGVALVKGRVGPGWVGYDIGCGACMVPTGRSVKDVFPSHEEKMRVYRRLYEVIPAGLGASHAKRICHMDYNLAIDPKMVPEFFERGKKKKRVAPVTSDMIRQKMAYQFGTLGGGNHFLEVGSNENDEVFVTVHSGSRKFGWLVAELYMMLAEHGDGDGFFDMDSDIGQAYWTDMNIMLELALQNRRYMMERALEVIGLEAPDILGRLTSDAFINENHNHAVEYDGGILHRKGATPADEGQLGVILISMGAGVYVTRGLGNVEFLSSASHGAGRKLGRMDAKRTLDVDRFRVQMKDIIAPVGEGTLDEAPDAYKDEDMVISAQKGVVVDILDVVRPIMVVKGGGKEIEG